LDLAKLWQEIFAHNSNIGQRFSQRPYWWLGAPLLSTKALRFFAFVTENMYGSLFGFTFVLVLLLNSSISDAQLSVILKSATNPQSCQALLSSAGLKATAIGNDVQVAGVPVNDQVVMLEPACSFNGAIFLGDNQGAINMACVFGFANSTQCEKSWGQVTTVGSSVIPASAGENCASNVHYLSLFKIPATIDAVTLWSGVVSPVFLACTATKS